MGAERCSRRCPALLNISVRNNSDQLIIFVYIQKVEEKAEELGLGKVVSVVGRFWALDREQNWDRVEKCYRQLVYGEGRAVVEG